MPEAVEQGVLEIHRLGASPANQVLLYLTGLGPDRLADERTLPECIDLLLRYHVRRAVTNVPATGSLDTAHIRTILACQRHVEAEQPLTLALFREHLLGAARPASAEQFAAALRGPIYQTSSDITRYLLVELDRHHHTREYAPNFRERKSKNFVWTIEHVLPQKRAVSSEWIKTLGAADELEAQEIRFREVHRLGNLTLSGFNSRLAAAPFAKKQQKTQKQGDDGLVVDIGYRNGLALNRLTFEIDGSVTSLAEADRWTAAHIEARTVAMADRLVQRFAFEDSPPRD